VKEKGALMAVKKLLQERDDRTGSRKVVKGLCLSKMAKLGKGEGPSTRSEGLEPEELRQEKEVHQGRTVPK